jgi:hypothetical protein
VKFKTDNDFYSVEQGPVPIYDLHATVLNALGIDRTKLTYKFQRRHFRLTDVAGNVVTQAPVSMRASSTISREGNLKASSAAQAIRPRSAEFLPPSSRLG